MHDSGTRSVSQRFRAIHAKISRYFRQHGYQIRGQTFWYPTPEVRRVVILDRSRWNTSDECKFSLVLGVFVPQFFTYLTGNPDPEYPKAQSSTMIMGINEIPDRPYQKRRLSWTLRHSDSSDTDIRILSSVLEELEKWVVPFLSRFTTITDVIDYLVWVYTHENSERWRPTRPNEVWLSVYLAILHHLRGEATLAEEELQKAMAVGGRGIYFAQEVSKIRERFRAGSFS